VLTLASSPVIESGPTVAEVLRAAHLAASGTEPEHAPGSPIQLAILADILTQLL
jgi:hypothetical protein